MDIINEKILFSKKRYIDKLVEYYFWSFHLFKYYKDSLGMSLNFKTRLNKS